MSHHFRKLSFYVIVFLLPGFFNKTFAQEAIVKSINKKNSSVIIDQGTSSGFSKKTKICIYNDADEVVYCTKIAKAKKNSAYFRVKSKKVVSKIKKDMLVKIQGPDPLIAGERTSASYKEGGLDHLEGSAKSNIKFGYILTPMAPSTYSKLAYLPPYVEIPGAGDSVTFREAESVDTLWENAGKSSLSLLGLGFEFEYGFSDNFALTTGLRYRIYKTFQSSTDYNMLDAKQYLELNQKGSANGVYFDFQFLNLALSSTSFWRVSSGLDYDMATVTFAVDHKVEPDSTSPSLGQLYKATSKLSTLSLRLGSSINLMFLESFGFYTGFNLLVPIVASGGEPELEIADLNALVDRQ